MNIDALILAVAAVVCFVVEAAGRGRLNFAALGLTLLTVAWIVQLVSVSHPIHT